MKRRPAPLFAVLMLLALGLPAAPVHADGLIICDPAPCPGPIPLTPLAIRYHHVTVSIRDQVAVTRVDQVFYNPNDTAVEGMYLFPLPEGAAVTGFILWVDGEAVEGQALDATQARQTYEQIVSELRDPALLEYAGLGAVQARIFPIPPGGERRVELEYTQALTAENGLVEYTYPLNTEKFSSLPLESVSVSVDISSSAAPVRAVYSPSHEIAVNRMDGQHVSAGYEEALVTPDADFTLYYSLGENEAFHLLTYRDPHDPLDPDGFFLLLLAPRPDVETQAIAKDVILVLDHSGSMEGEKFRQAQQALRFILERLNPDDRFNIVAFSSGVDTYQRNLRQVEEAQEAIAWVERLSAVGSTDINRALLEAAALAGSERPTYIIFLTDGLPTVGEVDSQRIVDNFLAFAPDSLSLFAFGVGYDVDTFLLDSLVEGRHGDSAYVQPGEALDEVLSAFYARISAPLLTGLELDFGGISAYDIHPSPLPDLFAGSQIIVTGRYREGGTATVTLRGTVNGQAQEFRFPGQVFTAQSKDTGPQASIPRLWATRKIGHLLNAIRLGGPDLETIDQIVKLSIRFGIVTPYTSYLVTEEAPLGAAEQERLSNQAYQQMLATPSPASSGQDAVQKAADQGGMAAAESASAPPAEAAEVVRIVGSHTFLLSSGVWVDTAFDPQEMDTLKVAFLSEEYFALASAYPDLAAAFALGPRVIAISDGTAYEVVAEDAATDPIDLPPTDIPETPVASDDPAPGPVPCASGFLALSLPLGAVLLGRRRKGKE